MFYTEFELVGYRRLAVSGIHRIKMTMTEVLQLILGTNGSGKSSLLNEISPLPANAADYHKSGSKIVHIEHRHRKYVLRSVFSPSQKHSFEVDGEQLNEGGTVTVQYELVAQHFGVTKATHELHSGRERFTQMSPSKRKEWFLRLCDTDYDYALRVFKKLSSKHRDTVGAINLTKEKLVEETTKLIGTDEEQALTLEAQNLHALLSALLEQRKPLEDDPSTLQIELTNGQERLHDEAKRLKRLMQQWHHPERTREELDTIQRTQQSAVDALQSSMQVRTQLFTSNQRKIEVLQKAEAQTIDSLQARMAEINREVSQLQSEQRVKWTPGRGHDACMAFETVRTQILEIMHAIPNNEDRRFSQQRFTQVSEENQRMTVLKADTQAQLSTLVSRMSHMKQHHDKPELTCPKCDHRFSTHYNEVEYRAMEVKAAALEAKIKTEIEPGMATLKDYLDHFSEYVGLYRQWTQVIRAWPVLQPYWDWLTELGVITDKPDQGLMYVQQIERDLSQQLKWDTLLDERQQKQQLLVALQDVGGADLINLQLQNKELEESIAQDTQQLLKARAELMRAKEALGRLEQITDLKRALQGMLQDGERLFARLTEAHRRQHYNQAVRSVQSLLAQVEYRLSQQAQQKAGVKLLQDQVTELEAEELALGILVKQLSPTEGLIAEGLIAFIHHFIAQMNQYIRKVWSYELVIQAGELIEGENVDLDYYFPLKVKGHDRPIGDVSRGSDGMKEIIDLSYLIIAMKCQGMQDHPLKLDEFGRSFDETHREQATMMIRSLVEQVSFPQIFLISHYLSSYGALANAQICALDTRNIVVPKHTQGVNEHVEFEQAA